MKRIFILILCVFISTLAFSRGHSFHSYSRSYGSHFHSRCYSTYKTRAGGTHWVRIYTKRNGTVVQGHLSGNPGSGVHCHNDVCQ